MTCLDVRNVQCRIGDRVIVDDVSFTAEAGQLTAIVGVNGVGKSTLLRSIAGVRKVNAGDVLLDGKSVNQYTPMQRARLMAFVGQEESPSPDLLLGEMVALGRTPPASRGRWGSVPSARSFVTLWLWSGWII